MRSSVLIAAPFVAAAAAQDLTSITGGTQTATISASGSALYTTTWTYSNPATNYLSETNSAGIVTGQPSGSGAGVGVAETEQPSVVTSQPPVATVPAGLPTGVTYIQYNGTAGFTSFQVSVGSSTTVVGGVAGTLASNGAVIPTESGSTGGSGGSGSNSGSNSGSESSSGSGSGDASSTDASASQSGNAASSVRVAGAGIGLFAFIAALL